MRFADRQELINARSRWVQDGDSRLSSYCLNFSAHRDGRDAFVAVPDDDAAHQLLQLPHVAAPRGGREDGES